MPNEVKTGFIYDASGTRVKKSVEKLGEDKGLTSSDIYYFGNYHVEFKGDKISTVTKYYPTRGAKAFRKNGELFFSLRDHLGSTNIVIDDKSQYAGQTHYYPYGTQYSSKGALNTEYQFSGHIKDSSTDLYYFNARYFDPVTGRFISADSVEGPNRYAYAANNPIKYTDPTGNMLDAGGGTGGISALSYDPLEGLKNQFFDIHQPIVQSAAIQTTGVIGPVDMSNEEFKLFGALMFGGGIGGGIALGLSAGLIAPIAGACQLGIDWCAGAIGETFLNFLLPEGHPETGGSEVALQAGRTVRGYVPLNNYHPGQHILPPCEIGCAVNGVQIIDPVPSGTVARNYLENGKGMSWDEIALKFYENPGVESPFVMMYGTPEAASYYTIKMAGREGGQKLVAVVEESATGVIPIQKLINQGMTPNLPRGMSQVNFEQALMNPGPIFPEQIVGLIFVR